ncbi:MAG: hypothetical protein ABJH28_10835 [Paraglaciecola sp.]|uniref:hypothetical protein n=1 Tax=Paraglaciecola sp. TaxID=1920173 RepID=UPI003262F03A
MTWGITSSLIVLSSPIAYAGIQADFDRELIEVSEAETRYTNKQKLFDKRCEMVKQYVDTDGTILRKAMGHSCEKLTIGVALLAGDDLGKHSPEKVASHFENELAKHKMQSKVFIQKGYKHGTSLVFFVDGSSYYANYVNPVQALDSLKSFVADVRLMYFKNGQITFDQLAHWIKSAPALGDDS